MFTTFLKRFTTNVFNFNSFHAVPLMGILFSLFFFLIPACKKDLSPIEIFKSLKFPPPGIDTTSHDFTWEIDTLQFPGVFQILPNAIWGSDTNDVWMVAHSDDWHARIWHWDGKEWQAYTNSGLGVSPQDIIGFESDDIWFSGNRIGNNPVIKTIWHWDGTAWNIVEHHIETHIMSMWGSSSQNMYFGLIDGRIAHYDGNDFQVYDTGTGAQILDMHGISEKEIYAVGIAQDQSQPSDSTFYYMFNFDGKNWRIINYYIDTAKNEHLPFPKQGLWNSDEYLLGANGRYVYYLTSNNTWEIIFEPSTKGVWKLGGTGLNNIFTTGYFGNSIYHYNGKSWKDFNELNDLYFFSKAIQCFKNNVFIAGYANNKAYVIRGKRKEVVKLKVK